MECREFQQLINMEIDHCLPASAHDELMRHLSGCPHCLAYYQSMQQLDSLLAAEMPAVEPPADFVASVMSALPAAQTAAPRSKQRRKRRIAWGLASAAAALMLLAGGWLHFFGFNDIVDPNIVAKNNEDEGIKPPFYHWWKSNNRTDPDLQLPDDITDPDDNQGGTVVATLDPSVTDDPDHTYIQITNTPMTNTDSYALGSYNALALASYLDCDALLPSVSGGMVTYYTLLEGEIVEWQTAIDGSGEPVATAIVEQLPHALGLGSFEFNEQYGDVYQASSPNGRHLAINSAEGLFLQVNGGEPVLVAEHGGGSIVKWAADNNKVMFTDSQGFLYVYYIIAGANQLLETGFSNVTSACWSDSFIVFSAYDNTTGWSSVFCITTP